MCTFVEMTVASARMSSTTTGFPTMLLAPTQTQPGPGSATPVRLDHLQHRERRARHERPAAVDDVADVGGVDALDVLVRIDQRLDPLGVDALRERQVHHDRVLTSRRCSAAARGRRCRRSPRPGELVEDVLDPDLRPRLRRS